MPVFDKIGYYASGVCRNSKSSAGNSNKLKAKVSQIREDNDVLEYAFLDMVVDKSQQDNHFYIDGNIEAQSIKFKTFTLAQMCQSCQKSWYQKIAI